MSHEPEPLALWDCDGVKSAEVVMDRRDPHHRLARARRVLVVPAQPPIPPQPGEGPLHYPATLQRHEPPLARLAADDHHLVPAVMHPQPAAQVVVVILVVRLHL